MNRPRRLPLPSPCPPPALPLPCPAHAPVPAPAACTSRRIFKAACTSSSSVASPYPRTNTGVLPFSDAAAAAARCLVAPFCLPPPPLPCPLPLLHFPLCFAPPDVGRVRLRAPGPWRRRRSDGVAMGCSRFPHACPRCPRPRFPLRCLECLLRRSVRALLPPAAHNYNHFRLLSAHPPLLSCSHTLFLDSSGAAWSTGFNKRQRQCPHARPLAPACSCSFLRLQWAAGHRQHRQHIPPPARHPQAPRRLPLRRRRSLRIRHAPRSRPRLLPSHHVCVPASNPNSPLLFSRVSCRRVVPVRQQQAWAAWAA